jgi:uncharacterized protein YkwD
MPRHPAAVMTFRRPAPRVIALVLAALMTAGALAHAAPVRASGGDGLREAANAYRTEHGLNPVVGTPLLDDIASRRAARMAADNRLQHDLDYVYDRLNAAGVCWSLFGEIIAWERGYPDYSYARTMKQWWESDGHRAVLMTPEYNAAGGAWDTAPDGGHYSAMIFVVLCGDSISVEPSHKLYPDTGYDPDRLLVLKAGRVTGYKLDRFGKVLAQKTLRLANKDWARSAGIAHPNGKSWLKVSTGAFAGYWVEQSADTFVRGRTDMDRFDPEHRLKLEAGRYDAFQFDWMGRVTKAKSDWFGQSKKFTIAARAVINGRRFYLLSSGPLQGYWLLDTPRVTSA